MIHALLYAVLIASGSVHSQNVVSTEYGPVRGHLVKVNNGVEQTTVEVFQGIPFAKETSGARRFMVCKCNEISVVVKLDNEIN